MTVLPGQRLCQLPAGGNYGLIVLAACAENQATLNYQHSEFVKKLERLAYPGGRFNPDCRSYAWLRRELRKDTPDVERPDIPPTARRPCASAHSGPHPGDMAGNRGKPNA